LDEACKSLKCVYGPDAQAIAVGSTSGPESVAHFVRLNWSSFSRDLIVAHHFSHSIGIYNLEGCIQQGFLHRLPSFDWNQTVVIPAALVRKALQFRTRVQTAIWIGSHLLLRTNRQERTGDRKKRVWGRGRIFKPTPSF
jgi:hypothetical protein